MSDLRLSVIIGAVDRLTQPVRKIVQTTDQLTRSVQQQRGEMERLGRTTGDIAHFKKLKTATGQTSKELVDARNQATRLGRELSQVEKPTRKMQQQFDRARRSVQQLEQQYQSQQVKLQGLRRGLSQAGVSTRNLTSEQRRLKTEADKASAALDRQNRRLQNMQAARQKISTGLATAANMMFVGHAAGQVGRTAAGLLSAPITVAADFEAAMSGVGAVARANAGQLATLTSEAKRLGATTRYSAVESAQGMKYLAMAGFSTEQIVTSLPGVMSMATAGATDLGRASDIASDILSAFGLEAGQMGRVADTLTATFTRSNTSLEMLGETMKYVGPVARGAGMSLEETAAMAGLLGNVGIKASQAGTTLRAMLQRLGAPTGAAATTLRSLGIEVQDLEGNMRSVPELLGELAAATSSMGSGERLSILKTLFDAEAAAGVSELIAKQGSQGVSQFIEILHQAKGEAGRVAQQMDNNASGGFKALNSAVEGLKIAFGDLLLPTVQVVTTMLTGLTRRLNDFVETWPNLSRWIGYGVAAIAGLAFVFSGLMTLLAGVVGAMVITRFGLKALGLSGLFSAFSIKKLALSFIGLATKAIPVVLTGLKALTVALMTNPIGLIVGGIALAAGLIVANWGSIGPWFSGLWQSVKQPLMTVWELIKTVFSYSPLGMLVKAWQPMLNWIGEKMGWVGDLVGGIKGIFTGDSESPTAKAREVGLAAAVTTAVAATPVAAAPAVSQTHQNQYTIQVQQQPGESSDELARKVMDQIRSHESQQRKGAQYDYE